ncbi:MAG: hypothetical protein KatS3mg113_0818 [Planctomycetaceae bacterium]|nr:MAG: hypothetical protein KatS3mg113_0818 [Planctomycetaceae bacterium]
MMCHAVGTGGGYLQSFGRLVTAQTWLVAEFHQFLMIGLIATSFSTP